MKAIMVVLMLMACLGMEILAASMGGISGGQKGMQDYAQQVLEDQEPAEDRTLGLITFLAIFPAIKKWFLNFFSASAILP